MLVVGAVVVVIAEEVEVMEAVLEALVVVLVAIFDIVVL
jgi:hypothetical protein